jgi:tRNA A37 methylthiotransferase MiaB
VTCSTPPKVGFVSLGCPKALVDSERILTQLRAEGDLVSGSAAALISRAGARSGRPLVPT